MALRTENEIRLPLSVSVYIYIYIHLTTLQYMPILLILSIS